MRVRVVFRKTVLGDFNNDSHQQVFLKTTYKFTQISYKVYTVGTSTILFTRLHLIDHLNLLRSYLVPSQLIFLLSPVPFPPGSVHHKRFTLLQSLFCHIRPCYTSPRWMPAWISSSLKVHPSPVPFLSHKAVLHKPALNASLGQFTTKGSPFFSQTSANVYTIIVSSSGQPR